jgi:hypothetical protein
MSGNLPLAGMSAFVCHLVPPPVRRQYAASTPNSKDMCMTNPVRSTGISRFFTQSFTPPFRGPVRWVGIAVLGFAGLVFVSWLGVPPLVKYLLAQQVEQQFGRKAAVADVSFNPLTLTMTASDFTLYEPDGTTTALSAKSLLLDLSIRSLFQLAPVLQQVTLSGPSMHIVRTSLDGNGRYNFSDIIDRVLAQPETDGGNARFAVSNIELLDGSITFDDNVTGKSIAIAALNIGVPQVSNFASAVDVFVLPSLSMTVNGSPFALKGRSKPFSMTQETALALDIEQFDVAKYAALLPMALPVVIESGKLSTTLDLTFVRSEQQPQINLSGDVKLTDVALFNHAAAPLFKAQSLAARVDQLDLLTASVALGKIHLQSPEVWADLDANGTFNWAKLAAPAKPKEIKPLETKATQTKLAETKPAETKLAETKPAQEKPRQFTLAQFTVSDGIVNWRDAANATPALDLQIKHFAADVQKLSLDKDAAPASVALSAGGKDAQDIRFAGTVAPLSGAVAGRASIGMLPLALYQPYVNGVLATNLSGRLSLQTKIAVDAGIVTLEQLNAQIAAVALVSNAGAAAGTKADAGVQIRKISLENARVDTGKRTFNAASLGIVGLKADVQRAADGAINLAQLAKPAAKSESKFESKAESGKSAGKSVAWVANLGSVAVTEGNIAFTDSSVQPAVTLRAEDFNLKLEGVSSKLDKPIALALATTLNRRGKLAIDGSVAPQLAALDLAIDASALPVAALQPYFADLLNASLKSGRADVNGKLQLTFAKDKQALAARYSGALGLRNFSVVDKENAADFLRWKALDVKAIDASIDGAGQNITLGKIELDDFFVRAILSSEGVLNLQEILVSKAGRKSVVPEAAGQSGAKPATSAAMSDAKPVAAAAVKSDDPATKQMIRIGEVILNNGNIDFTDNFIKPNYTANLTGMSGSIGTLASDQSAPAAIDLSGKIDDDAPVTISGSLSPLSKPMFLDIKGSANDVELSRLTPYAAKYAGYEILRGKLSMDVSYKIEELQLTAQNRVLIDQLTFGERIDSPSATDLPVQLAVALLKDRNGRIDINLPITGSLSDPQFSIGAILGRVFVNLIAKAVTSPFALLGSIFGGGSEELGFAEFKAGSAQLSPAAMARLDTLAKALNDRPGLKLDISGRIDPASDEPGLRRENLQSQLHALQRTANRRRARAAGEAAVAKTATQKAAQPADIVLTTAERAEFLERIYNDAQFDKPRNAIGLVRSLPPVQMEQLILANASVTQDDLRALADRRAQAVRKYLETKGKISLQRIFLVAPRLNADGIEDKGALNRVDFEVR